MFNNKKFITFFRMNRMQYKINKSLFVLLKHKIIAVSCQIYDYTLRLPARLLWSGGQAVSLPSNN